MARKTKQPSDMSSLFKSSQGTLAQIKTKTNSLSKIASIVQQICPDLPEDVWHVGNISNNTLIIEVLSSVWGQRFQFERNNITQALQSSTDGFINRIEIKVRPFQNRKIAEQPAPVKTQFISHDTAEKLREVAENAPDSLKRTLERLASLANRSPK